MTSTPPNLLDVLEYPHSQTSMHLPFYHLQYMQATESRSRGLGMRLYMHTVKNI